MFRGLSQRSKQSSKELEEIARMTEPCLFSDRLIHCQWVLLVPLFSDLCKYPHTVSHTQSVGAAFREIPFCIPTTITWWGAPFCRGRACASASLPPPSSRAVVFPFNGNSSGSKCPFLLLQGHNISLKQKYLPSDALMEVRPCLCFDKLAV